MTRTDKDTWDLSSSGGATATAVAASRAIASQQPDALRNDPWADPLVRAVGTDIFVKLVDGEIEHADDPLLNRRVLNEQIAVRTRFFDEFFMQAAYSANGFEVPKDDLMSFGDGSGYLTATLV